MTINASPIQQLSTLYVTNLNVSVASNTTLTITPGQARDSQNNMDIVLGNFLQTGAANTTLNAATTGANALDTGSLANSTFYSVFVIASSINKEQPATLLSTSATAPILPEGYDAFRRIGWVKTDGSAHFLAVYIAGNSNERVYRWDSVITVKASGAGNSSFQALSMVAAVPSTSTVVYMQSLLTANTAGNAVNFRPTGSSSTSNIGVSNPVTTNTMLSMISDVMTNTSQSVDWKTSESSDTLALWVAGFTDFI